MTTINTFRHPRTNVCEAMRPTSNRARGTSPIALKPCQTSTPAVFAGAGTRPGTDTRASRPADTRRAAAPTAKTAPTSANATSTPAPSGPRRVPRLSIVEVAPFAAISSLAVLASDGSSAMRAGRKSVEETPTADPAAKTTMRSSMTAPAAETRRAAAPRSTTPDRNRSRRKRSPREDANGAIAAAGSRRMRPAIPTAVDPPWLYANTPRATKCAHSAEIDAPQASSARRTSTFRAARRREAAAWRIRDRRVNLTETVSTKRCVEPRPLAGAGFGPPVAATTSPRSPPGAARPACSRCALGSGRLRT